MTQCVCVIMYRGQVRGERGGWGGGEMGGWQEWGNGGRGGRPGNYRRGAEEVARYYEKHCYEN